MRSKRKPPRPAIHGALSPGWLAWRALYILEKVQSFPEIGLQAPSRHVVPGVQASLLVSSGLLAHGQDNFLLLYAIQLFIAIILLLFSMLCLLYFKIIII